MKTILLFYYILFSSICFGAPNSGDLVKDHKNSDGSIVGMVTKTAKESEILENIDNEGEAPKDPGERGLKTILGIDSNVNGIRDDVEIWINSRTMSTPIKDMYNARMALRQISKNIQINIRMKDNRKEAIKFGKYSIEDFRCLQDLVTPEEFEILSGDLQIVIYNTTERLKVWARLQGYLNGQSFKVVDVKNRSTCNFKIR